MITILLREIEMDKKIYILSTLLFMSSCADFMDNRLDKKLKMSYEEYENNMIKARENYKEKEKNEPKKLSKTKKFPKFSQMLARPKIPTVGSEKKISLSVTEDVPLKDTFIEIGRLAGLDMEVDPKIKGGVILSVRNKPLSEVVDRLARLGGLRYSNKGGVLYVERDMPYIEDYQVDFINVVRSNKSDSAVNTSIASSSEGTSGGSTSNNTISSSYEGDLWKSVEGNIKQILAYHNYEETAPNTKTEASKIAINKQASIVSVVGNSRQQDAVRKYLNSVNKSVSSQVLIEAKIVEVALKDEFRSGIDWEQITTSKGNSFSFSAPLTKALSNEAVFTAPNDLMSLTAKGSKGNNRSVLSLIENFGTTRTISSPRINAMNNQQAVLSFVENKVYFKVSIESDESTTDDTGSGGNGNNKETFTLSSELNTVPIGIIMAIQPSINLDAQEITMNIRPSLSSQSTTINDPAVAYLAGKLGTDEDRQNISSAVPVVQVKEIDSVVKVKNGDIIIIGGLMEERSYNEDSGIPGIGRTPGIGNFFKSANKQSQLVQTVIFMKATIVENNFTPIEDKHFYNTFVKPRDPNAWEF